MSEPNIPQRAPYVLSETPGVRAWCSCGRSAKQPFCDGSHAGTSFSPLRTTVVKPGPVAWCGCKKSGKPPFCDGTHSRL